MAGETETFRAYANYIRAFAHLAGLPPLALPDATRTVALAERIRANAVAVAAPADQDLKQVRSSLVNAWGTEMILNVTMVYAQEDELVGLTNNWSAVQLYYVAYHATQALLVARGYKRPQSHAQTQRMFADLWVTRPMDLPPWSLGAGASGVRNGPGRELDQNIHPWSASNSTTCWDLAAKAIRTTREDVVTESLRRLRLEKQRVLRRELEARQKSRGRNGEPPVVPLPRLTPPEKTKAAAGVRDYTFLDFLYRLRIKTNYEDAAVFVEGPESPAQARMVRRDLAHLAATTLLLHEIQIGLAIGEERLRQWADDWLARNHPGGRPLGLARRRPVL